MKKYRWITVLLTVIITLTYLPAANAIEEAPAVEGQNVMVVCLNTGAAIYEKNADERIHPASTTKLMTMAVAIDLIDNLQEKIVFDKEAAYTDLVIGSSNMGLKDEEEITVEDMLYGIALSSANEATNMLAIRYCGSIAAFVQKMNERAQEWGMNNTHFVNTHGLTDENHYTTVRDLSILSKHVFTDERLLPYLSASSYTLPETNKNEEHTLTTTNALLRLNSGHYYKYAVAGKTGTTSAAGYNLISVARYKGMEYLCLDMHADYDLDTNPVFEDSIALFKWAYNNFSIRTLLEERESVCEIPVALCAKTDYVMLSPEKPIEAVVADDVDIAVFERVIETEEKAFAPVHTGDVLGTVTLVKDGVEYGKVNLVAGTDLERSTILYYLYLVRQFFKNKIVQIVSLVLIVLIIAYIVFMILQNNNRRRRRLSRRIRF